MATYKNGIILIKKAESKDKWQVGFMVCQILLGYFMLKLVEQLWSPIMYKNASSIILNW